MRSIIIKEQQTALITHEKTRAAPLIRYLPKHQLWTNTLSEILRFLPCSLGLPTDRLRIKHRATMKYLAVILVGLILTSRELSNIALRSPLKLSIKSFHQHQARVQGARILNLRFWLPNKMELLPICSFQAYLRPIRGQTNRLRTSSKMQLWTKAVRIVRNSPQEEMKGRWIMLFLL